MKKIFFSGFTFAMLLAACGSGDNKSTGPTTASENKSSGGGSFYFDYSVDGKELHVNPEDVSASYYVTGKNKVFKIFASKENEPGVMLVIPHDMTQPSSTPNGSPDFDQEITQGSVSLQNYPEKGYTTNSFNTIYPEMSVPTPDAVIITSTEKDGETARIISGTFNTTTYGEKDGKDPKDTNHKVSGKFRIRHEFSSTNGGAF